MACKNCTSACACRLKVMDTNTIDLTLAGSGSASSPWVVSGVALIDGRPASFAQGTPQADASDAANFLLEIVGDDGGLTVFPSLDDNNRIRVGSDGGIYVPIVGSDCLNFSGLGTEAEPFVITPIISEDCGEFNFLQCTDDGLCVPLSADNGNIVTVGADGGIFAPASPIDAGCGISIAGGQVSVNVSNTGDSWPLNQDDPHLASDCPITDGTQIGCGDDLQIYGPPEHETSQGFTPHGPTAVPVGTVLNPGECIAGNVVQHDIVNPSDCRPLAVHVQYGLVTGDWIGDAGAQMNLGYIRSVPPAATAGGVGGGQAPGPFVAPGAVMPLPAHILVERNPPVSQPGLGQSIDLERDFFNLVIPPGQTVTFEHQVVVCNVGTGAMIANGANVVGSIRHWGGTA